MRHLIATALLSLLTLSCVVMAQNTQTKAEKERAKLEKKLEQTQRKLSKLQPSAPTDLVVLVDQPAVQIVESHPIEVVTEQPTVSPVDSPTSCASMKDAREKEICFRAWAIQADKEAKRLRDSRIKADSPVMRQARKQINEEDRERAKEARVIRELSQNAEVSGCEADESVWVNPVGQRTSRWVATVNVRVTNYGRLPINVESSRVGYGTLVRNLCSGGSVSLHFVLRPFVDPNYLQIPLRAIARTPDGRVATSDFPLYLSAFDSQNERERNLVWGVKLNLQSQTR